MLGAVRGRVRGGSKGSGVRGCSKGGGRGGGGGGVEKRLVVAGDKGAACCDGRSRPESKRLRRRCVCTVDSNLAST